MHEYSITRAMLDAALAEAGRHPGSRVTGIRLLVGEAAGVVPDCVEFYFDRMKEGTAAEQATLEFRRVPTVLRCPKCGAEFADIDGICACNAGAGVVSGQELTLESIELEEGEDNVECRMSSDESPEANHQ